MGLLWSFHAYLLKNKTKNYCNFLESKIIKFVFICDTTLNNIYLYYYYYLTYSFLRLFVNLPPCPVKMSDPHDPPCCKNTESAEKETHLNTRKLNILYNTLTLLPQSARKWETVRSRSWRLILLSFNLHICT